MQYVDLGKTVEQHQRIRDMKEAQQRGVDNGGFHNGGLPNGKKNPEKKKKKFIWVGIIALVLVLGFVFRESFAALFGPVSIISNVPTHNLKTTDGRTNILVLGKDARSTGTETSVLTDTLLFASIGEVENNVAMISLPRDLWVKADAGRGVHFMKINSVYAVDGADELVNVIENVLGMPVHYYVVVDFNLFRNAVDILGGIDVDVENSFIDYQYPVEGNEASLCGRTAREIEEMQDYAYHIVFPCRYETVEFEAGLQTMDGETALKYVRSRKGNNNEGTDFARSKRQQNVIMAIKDKALTLNTLMDVTKIKEFYELYSESIDTNVGLMDVQGFYMLSQQINFDAVRSIVLDDRSGADEGGLLYHPTDSSLYGGAYVLIPKVGSYSQIHAYVQRYIFGDL